MREVIGSEKERLDGHTLKIFKKQIEELNRTKKELKREQQLYRIALGATADYIFEYDVTKDELIFYGGPYKTNVGPSKLESFIVCLKEKYYWDSEQLERLETLEDFMFGRSSTAEIKINRLENEAAEKRWYSFNGKPIYEDDMLVKVIGRISDITNIKENEERLLKEAYFDGLTGAYKPSKGLLFLEEFFRTRETRIDYALIFVDILNISTINDTYCMAFGNAILKFTADELRKVIPPEDLLIRVGGSQFTVLCRHTDKRKTVSMAQQFLTIPDRIYTGDLEEAKAEIGIIIAEPVEWDGFPELAQVLDEMKEELDAKKEPGLYYADPAKLLPLCSGKSIYPSCKNYQGMSSQYCTVKRELLSFAYEILEKSKVSHSAIQMLLYTVGKCTKLRYIRIFDVDVNYLTRFLSYQWAREEKDIKISKISRYPSYEALSELWDIFNKKGAFELTEGKPSDCTDTIRNYIIKEHRAKRLYLNQIMADGKAEGVIIYGSDQTNEWTEEERKFYSSLTQLLAIHIEKQRSDSENKAKTEFLSRMSHEIRTPINGIAGMIELLKGYINQKNEGQEKKAIDEQIEACMSKLDISLSYLVSIIDDLVEMAKIESGNLKMNEAPFRMDELADHLQSMFEIKAKNNNQSFALLRKCDHEHVIGDYMRMMQIFVNLISNAVKFTPKLGKITVVLEQTKQTDERIYYHFSVKDTGCGISEAEQESLFHSFAHAKKRVVNSSSVGLGLSISQNIVTKMGGRLELISKTGEGTEFYFDISLPRAAEAAGVTSQVKATEHNQINFSGKRILLAEDNELNAEIAEAILRTKGFAVDIAQDGMVAVDRFCHSKAGYYDAIIMDIRMPNVDGFAATKQIRVSEHEEARTIPIIAMTSDAFDEDMKRSVYCGMNGYLTKPVQPDKLISVLESVIYTDGISDRKEGR